MINMPESRAKAIDTVKEMSADEKKALLDLLIGDAIKHDLPETSTSKEVEDFGKCLVDSAVENMVKYL